MKIIEITEEDTSVENVGRFLEEVKDPNILHREYGILPGMYSLFQLKKKRALSPKCLSGLEINFEAPTKYPIKLEMPYSQSETSVGFEVFNGKRIYTGSINQQANYEDELNGERLWMVYLIGGELQRQFEGSNHFPSGYVGIYNSQTMQFNDHATNGKPPKIGNPIKIGKRDSKVNMFYESRNGEIAAYGTARITVIPEKVLMKMVENLN